MTYESAKEELGARQSRRLPCVNTYLKANTDGTISVEYRGTPVVTFRENGDVVLNSGGWLTATTKSRMNDYLPDPYFIVQDKGVWYLRKSRERLCAFADGLTLHADGRISGAREQEASLIANALKRIDKYVRGFMKAFEKRAIPSLYGDCLYCSIIPEVHGEFPGEVPDHLKMHFEEEAYVGSLLLRALDKYLVGSFVYATAVGVLKGDDSIRESELRICLPILRRQLRRYLKYLCGFSA